MRLDHSFTVPVPVDAAWPVLLDLPTVAPCLPGARLGEPGEPEGSGGSTRSGSSGGGRVPVELAWRSRTARGRR